MSNQRLLCNTLSCVFSINKYHIHRPNQPSNKCNTWIDLVFGYIERERDTHVANDHVKLWFVGLSWQHTYWPPLCFRIEWVPLFRNIDKLTAAIEHRLEILDNKSEYWYPTIVTRPESDYIINTGLAILPGQSNKKKRKKQIFCDLPEQNRQLKYHTFEYVFDVRHARNVFLCSVDIRNLYSIHINK